MAGPDWLKLAAQAASLRNVAVAICQTPTGWHVGLLFFDADRESLRLLDLAWHLKLRNEPFDAAKPELLVWPQVDHPFANEVDHPFADEVDHPFASELTTLRVTNLSQRNVSM